MTTRLREAIERLSLVESTLDELAEVLVAPALDSKIEEAVLRWAVEGEVARQPARPTPAPAACVRPARGTRPRGAMRAAGVAALPISLASALAVFGVLRLEPANTLWSQELTLSSNVGTGKFGCDPITLKYDGLTHPSENETRLVYRLSGGGTNGPGCQTKDISNFSIQVCFNPEMGDGKPVIGETHPGTGSSAWTYSPKNASTPKLVKWDSKTTAAPLGGKGPFDPDEMVFTFTVGARLEDADLVESTARFKAGPQETDAGVVKAPHCPLPTPAPSSTTNRSALATSEATSTTEARPEDDVTPVTPSSTATGTPTPTSTPTPRPTPSPTGRAPRAVVTGVAIYQK